MNLHWPGIRLSWIYPGACYPDLGAAPFRIDYGRHEFHSNHPSSPVIDGQRRIAVRSIVAAKLALYSAMRAQRITKTELARRMGLSEGAIRKLLNLDHRSHIGQVERALRIVGRSLVLTDEPALQLN